MRSRPAHVAEVELQHHVACDLQCTRTPRQRTADFLTDVGKVEAGMNGGWAHGCKRSRDRAC
jgi:hypothetical protein